MKFKKSAIVVVAAAVFTAGAAYAESDVGRPTPDQMKAVHACAAKKGVSLPEPPSGPPPGARGEGAQGMSEGQPPQGNQAGGPPPPPKDGDKHQPPKLTDAEKAVVDACFKELGLTPPPMHHHEEPDASGAPKGE
jgi:hypothetical protein